VLTELAPELRFVRCSLCAEPMGLTHRLERAGSVVTVWCWSAAGGERVGVDASGDERFAPTGDAAVA
jgi:hypothetical protein